MVTINKIFVAALLFIALCLPAFTTTVKPKAPTVKCSIPSNFKSPSLHIKNHIGSSCKRGKSCFNDMQSYQSFQSDVMSKCDCGKKGVCDISKSFSGFTLDSNGKKQTKNYRKARFVIDTVTAGRVNPTIFGSLKTAYPLS